MLTSLIRFTNHDFRGMEPDITLVQLLIKSVKKNYPDVTFKYCDVREAFNRTLFGTYNKPDRNILKGDLSRTEVDGQRKLTIKSSEKIFGPQPFLAVQTKDGTFHHDNFDFQTPFREWSYIFDDHTFPEDTLKRVGVAANDQKGFYHTLQFNTQIIM